MDQEQKLDFKNITKDDVAKLAAPHLNYVQFDYINSAVLCSSCTKTKI